MGMRLSCHTFWMISSQWHCSKTLHILYPQEYPVHPPIRRWTLVFVLNNEWKMKNICSAMRSFCHTLLMIWSKWYCNWTFCVVCTHERPLHPIHSRWTVTFVLNAKRRNPRIFAIDWGDPVLLLVQFTFNGVVVAPCIHCTHTNSLYILPLGG